MTIDERLEFLLHSTESLHASCEQLHATVAEHSRQMEAADTKANNLRIALLKGIRAYLESANNGEETESK